MTREQYRISLKFGCFLLDILKKETDLSWSANRSKAVSEWLDWVENERAITRSMY